MTAKETEKKEKTIAEQMEELVEYTAPFGADLKDDSILVAVNGDEIRIKRGETVKIKRKFVEALNNAAKQERAAADYQRAALKAAEKAAVEM